MYNILIYSPEHYGGRTHVYGVDESVGHTGGTMLTGLAATHKQPDPFLLVPDTCWLEADANSQTNSGVSNNVGPLSKVPIPKMMVVGSLDWSPTISENYHLLFGRSCDFSCKQ